MSAFFSPDKKAGEEGWIDPQQGELFASAEVCRVPDEVTGMAVISFLLDQGIPARLRDMSGSFYGGVFTTLQGYWGIVIVDAKDENRARTVYAEFQKEFRGR